MQVRALGVVACAMLAPVGAGAQSMSATPGWASAGDGISNTRAAVGEHAVSPATAGELAPLWTVTASGEIPDTPTVEGNAVYFVDFTRSVWRVDAKSGAVVWRVDLPVVTGNSRSVSRTSPAIGARTVIIGDQAAGTLYALDKTSGTLVWRSRLDGARAALITSSPVIVGDRVVVGVSSLQEELAATVKGFVPNFRGSVAAVDLATGKMLWQTYTVPDGYTGGGVWGSNLAVDLKRGSVFAGSGDNYSVPPAVASCQGRARDGAQQDRCLAANDRIDSVMALDLSTGAVKWSRRMTTLDTWTVSCLPSSHAPATPCPQPAGLDYDFGSAPNLFSTTGSGTARDLVGVGQKSGIYWALDRDSGATVWATQVNPGGTRGGIEWGSAVGGGRVYVAASNANYVWTGILGSTKLTDGGFWSALDVNSGKILWQTATDAKQPLPAGKNSRTIKPPAGALARAEGAVTYANGVMFGADAAGNFVGLNAATGAKLWKYAAGGAAVDGPSVVDGVVYWGDGYGDIGRTSCKVYAFSVSR